MHSFLAGLAVVISSSDDARQEHRKALQFAHRNLGGADGRARRPWREKTTFVCFVGRVLHPLYVSTSQSGHLQCDGLGLLVTAEGARTPRFTSCC